MGNSHAAGCGRRCRLHQGKRTGAAEKRIFTRILFVGLKKERSANTDDRVRLVGSRISPKLHASNVVPRIRGLRDVRIMVCSLELSPGTNQTASELKGKIPPFGRAPFQSGVEWTLRG